MPRNSKIECKEGRCCVISTAGARKGTTIRCFTRKRGKRRKAAKKG
jgi:hypothetical protein